MTASRRFSDVSPEKLKKLEALRQRRAPAAAAAKEPVTPALGPMPRTGRIPLSPAQQQFWLMQRLDADNDEYQLPFAYRLRGRLHLEALRRAFEEVVRRHEVLRTSFPAPDGVPYQVVSDAGTWELPFTDLSGLAGEERSAALAQIAEEFAGRLDIERGPLFRTRLVKLGEDEHVLMTIIHHLVCDAWSQGILLREVAECYQAFERDRQPSLPPLPVQYADYSIWQGKLLEGDELERRLAYWRGRLGDASGETLLPFKRSMPTDGAGALEAGVDLAVSRPLQARLRELSQRAGTTLFMTLTAAFRTLLYRYTGQTDLVLGALVANRHRGEIEDLVGVFLNSVALRTDVAGDARFIDLLAREKATALEAYEWQDTPPEVIANALAAAGQRQGRGPLFRVLVSAQEQGTVCWNGMGELGVESIDLFRATRRESAPEPAGDGGATHEPTAEAAFDLQLVCSETDGALDTIVLVYSTTLFDREAIEQLGGHFLTLLEAVTADPTCRVRDLPLVTDEDRRLTLREWNATGRAYPRDRWIHQLIEAQVDRTPDAVAVRFEGEELTYRQLDDRCNRLAHRLLRTGAGPERPVGVLLERSLDMVVSLVAIVKAGAAFMPIDPTYPRERVHAILESSRARQVVGHSRWQHLLDGSGVSTIWLDAADPLAGEPSTRPAVAVAGSSMAYVLFTSGSTGRPKGVVNVHEGLLNRIFWTQELVGLTGDDVVLQKTPFTFDVSVWEFFWPLMIGARLVVARPEGHKDPGYLSELMQREGVTTLHFVPAMLEVFLASARPDAWQSVRRVIASGEALTGRHQSQFFAQARAGCELINLYGPTEAAIDVSQWRCRRDGREVNVPIGHPVANTQLYVLGERLDLVPPGASGELYIGGVQLARGYLGRPDLTAERFVPDPHGKPGARLYRTGDLATVRLDGAIEYQGRIDHQVKLRGFRIELGEIENVLAGHPSVAQCVAVVRELRAGDPQLVAYVVPVGGGVDRAALRAHLGGRLPEYMVPAVIVELEALPLTSSGKIDRKALPAPAEPTVEREHVPPATPVERALAEIWGEVLGAGRIGREDDFFERGGHSLLAVQLNDRIRRRFGASLPLRQVFVHSKLSQMAELVEAQNAEGQSAPSPLPAPAATGLTRARAYHHQLLAWRTSQQAPENPFVHLTSSLRFVNGLREEIMERALVELARRRSILRTTYEEIGGELTMNVRPAEPPAVPRLERVDLSGLPPAESERRAAAFLSAFRGRAFDLERGPVFRAAAIRVAGGSTIFSVVTHHIATDARSSGILDDELLKLYRGLVADPSASALDILGPDPLQYIDFAAFAERFAESAEGLRQRDFWRKNLAGAEAPRLPLVPTAWRQRTGRPGEVWVRPAGVAYAEIPAELSAALGRVGRENGATRSMTLLAAYAAALHESTGQNDLSIHNTYMQRYRPEFENLIGFMGNPLVMRIPIGGEKTFRELVGSVRDVVLTAYEHGEVPVRPYVAPELLAVNFNYAGDAVSAAADATLTASSDEAGGPVEWYEPVVEGERPRIWIPFDLILIVSEGREVGLQLFFNSDVYTDATAARILGRLRQVVELACARPDHPIASLSTPAEGAAPRPRRPPIVPVPRRGDAPLAFAQEPMWFSDQLNPENTTNHLVTARRLRGPLDVEALRRSFEGVVARHEILRTVFRSPSGVPVQVVCEPARWELPVRDLGGLDPPERQRSFDRIAATEALAPFDLARGPLLRTLLLRTAADDHALVTVIHHAIADGHSHGLFWDEVRAFYEAFSRGTDPVLPPLAIQYGDYAVWQRRWLTGAELERQLSFWKERLRGAPEEIALPRVEPPPARRSVRGAEVQTELDADTWARLRDVGRKNGATPFQTVLAGLRALLARESKQDDVCIGAPMSLRDSAVRSLIGCFVNTVVLRTRVERDDTFSSLLARERQRARETIPWQQTPFEAIVHALGVKRSQQRTPLCQVLLVFQNLSWTEEGFADLVVESIPPPQASPFELEVHVFEKDGRLGIWFTYDEDLFDRRVIERMTRDFTDLLRAVAADPDRPLEPPA